MAKTQNYLPNCGPKVPTSKELEAVKSMSGISPDSIPKGPLH